MRDSEAPVCPGGHCLEPALPLWGPGTRTGHIQRWRFGGSYQDINQGCAGWGVRRLVDSRGLTPPRPHDLALLWSPSSKKSTFLWPCLGVCGSCASRRLRSRVWRNQTSDSSAPDTTSMTKLHLRADLLRETVSWSGLDYLFISCLSFLQEIWHRQSAGLCRTDFCFGLIFAVLEPTRSTKSLGSQTSTGSKLGIDVVSQKRTGGVSYLKDG